MDVRHLDAEMLETPVLGGKEAEEAAERAEATILEEGHGEGRSRLQTWLDQRIEELNNDWDHVVVLTGNERTGKSTLAILMGVYADPYFHPSKNIAFTGPSYTRMSARLGRKRVCILDEAIDGAFSSDANTGENKGLFKYLTVAGERNQIHIINWPNIRFMDKRIKTHRSHWNIHVHRRYRDHAIAEVRLLKEGEYVFDPPKPVFPFSYQKVEGPIWDIYKKSKSAFVQDVGRGTDDSLSLSREDFLDHARRMSGPIVTEVKAGAV